MSARTVIVYGPMGCGKTRATEALAAHFKLSVVVDDFDPKRHRLTRGALHLAHVPWPGPEARSFAFDEVDFNPLGTTRVIRRRPEGKRTFGTRRA